MSKTFRSRITVFYVSRWILSNTSKSQYRQPPVYKAAPRQRDSPRPDLRTACPILADRSSWWPRGVMHGRQIHPVWLHGPMTPTLFSYPQGVRGGRKGDISGWRKPSGEALKANWVLCTKEGMVPSPFGHRAIRAIQQRPQRICNRFGPGRRSH